MGRKHLAELERDKERLDLIESVIGQDGYLYLHNNRAREPLGLGTKPGRLRADLDGLMVRRAAAKGTDGQKGGA